VNTLGIAVDAIRRRIDHMAEDNWGAAEPIRQSVHDLVHAIGTHLGLIPADAKPSQIAQDMTKQANDKAVQDANKSFLKPEQAATIRQKMSK
jgi:hypothetical protein